MTTEKRKNSIKNPSSVLNSVNKAISNNQNLKVNINSNIILEKNYTLNIPLLSNQFEYEDMRGSSDSFAFKIRYHNESNFNVLSLSVFNHKELLTAAEKIRYEYLGSIEYEGVKKIFIENG